MDRIPLRSIMGNSSVGDGGGRTFGVGDDAGGSMGGIANGAFFLHSKNLILLIVDQY